jgi:opacity protein-like surface antigen
VCSVPAQDAPILSPTLSLEVAPASPALPEPTAFLPTNWNIGFTLGAGFGVTAMGSTEAHHLTAATLHVGKLLESERPFLRHVELAGELWSGAQYHPDTAYLVGLTPVVRYHFLPPSRLDPFFDAGAGVTATDIGRPDLSTTFEFNLQAGAGFHWVLWKNMAFTFDARYIHLSNAGIDKPNNGVNAFLFSGGLTWFF